MKFLWCDTETTGKDTDKAAPIQIAFIFVYSKDGRKEEFERVFFLNPYDIPDIEHSKEAEEIHGYSKEQIEEFPKSSVVVKQIYNCLCEYEKYRDGEKLNFVGYNSNFDYNHLSELFRKHGYNFNEFFEKNIDVFEQVKKAGQVRVLPYLENRKLVTVAKHLGYADFKAHDALSDIKATRFVAKSLAQKKVPLF